eukprot:4717233-Prymnesium_polylepis.1
MGSLVRRRCRDPCRRSAARSNVRECATRVPFCIEGAILWWDCRRRGAQNRSWSCPRVSAVGVGRSVERLRRRQQLRARQDERRLGALAAQVPAGGTQHAKVAAHIDAPEFGAPPLLMRAECGKLAQYVRRWLHSHCGVPSV